jgi:hypothetical protein
MSDIIYTDRSRISEHEHCPRLRFWHHEWQGRGIEKVDDLKLDARIGTWTHWGIEQGLSLGETVNARECAIGAHAGFIGECFGYVNIDTITPQLQHDIDEGAQIVQALVYAWMRVKAPRLLADGEVLAIEKELTVDFKVPVPSGTQTVRLMARPDIIWRRKSDGTIFIRNLKTVRKPGDRWREQWALDMQTLSEPLAVDQWILDQVGKSLEHNIYFAGGVTCGGVIIDGLVTGEVLFDKYRGLFYHNNPLIYCWEGGDIGVTEKPVFYPRYEWSCIAPHKMGNGRKCEGGRTHKLSGVRKVSVADRYPEGIISWVDYLIDNDPAMIEEMLVELPPIIRSEYQIERWKRQVLPREVAINRWAKQVNVAAPEQVDAVLDERFPMHTAGGNCLYPGKCPCYDICFGSSVSDPLNSGFRWRQPNHPNEKENGSE